MNNVPTGDFIARSDVVLHFKVIVITSSYAILFSLDSYGNTCILQIAKRRLTFSCGSGRKVVKGRFRRGNDVAKVRQINYSNEYPCDGDTALEGCRTHFHQAYAFTKLWN